VVGDDQRHTLVAVHAAAQATDGLVGAQQGLHRKAPHGQDDLRLHEFDLPHQEGLALRQFGRLGIAVAGRAALQRVGDVDLALEGKRRGAFGGRLGTRQAQRSQHLIQKAPRRADEGLAAQVFLLARGFAHHHPVRARVAHAKDGLAPLLAQAAGPATGHGLAQGGPVQGTEVRGGQGVRGERGSWYD
jgi:hypothetical protein